MNRKQAKRIRRGIHLGRYYTRLGLDQTFYVHKHPRLVEHAAYTTRNRIERRRGKARASQIKPGFCNDMFPGDFIGPPIHCERPVGHYPRTPHHNQGMEWGSTDWRNANT